ncbi:ABC transporter ATP-binding protein [Halobaculum sp. MBLA0143]|uniref:ABC transporter ATP-binding protein n=1 Tax=Halobaculum sp. MBLA0143 TaxID=3079933 RepID=UPI0035243A9D
MSVIRVEGLHKRYGEGEEAVTAVEDVSFEIDSGSLVGILGPNGAGKTTVIKSILGLVIPTDGTVEIGGVDVFERPRVAYDRVGTVLEGARNIYWRLTVRENLNFFTRLEGKSAESHRDRHDELLDKLNLHDRADTTVNELSRGMKQKVSLAAVLAREPDVVFLDEPTLGLDVQSSRQLRSELQRLSETGVTVVLSSHDMDVIETLCDRVIILDDGTVVRDGTVSSMIDGFRTEQVRLEVDCPDAARLEPSLRNRHTVTSFGDQPGLTEFEVALPSGNALRDVIGTVADSDGEVVEVETVAPDFETAFVEITSDDGSRHSEEVQQ